MSLQNSISTNTDLRAFVEKVQERTMAFEQGDSNAVNAREAEIGNIYRRLRDRGRAAQELLLSLLDDPDLNVRCEAANYVLDFQPERALPVLETIAAIPEGRFAGSCAETALDLWKSGDFKIA